MTKDEAFDAIQVAICAWYGSTTADELRAFLVEWVSAIDNLDRAYKRIARMEQETQHSGYSAVKEAR